MNEKSEHLVALSIAILGPLVNLFIKPLYLYLNINPYLYWSIALSLYIAILLPFVYKSLLTLLRLIILGIFVEDFFSNLWSYLLLGKPFLPFVNWYTRYFPFLGS